MDRRRRLAGVALVFACILLFAALHLVQRVSPLTPSPYNSYTRQALAWRSGQAALPGDVPHLELAIFEGRYYVSFPPVPSVPIYFLTFLFGENVPDALLTEACLLAACLLFYRMLSRRLDGVPAALLSFLMLFASSLTPIAASGAVWHLAQAMAMACIAAALCLMDGDRPAPALFFYALSVGCRPFHALYALPLYGLYMMEHGLGKNTLKRLLPGTLLGLAVAAAYAWYNALRFQNPLEFGHNHLPEFSFQGGTQFSLDHIAKNFSTFVLGSPFQDTAGGRLLFAQFGFSLFLANPALLYVPLSAGAMAVRRRFACPQALVLTPLALHILLLLSHRTVGGYQWGARYFVDCLPYALWWLCLPGGAPRPKARYALYAALLAVLALALAGTAQINLWGMARGA